jgi:hypothetical protein
MSQSSENNDFVHKIAIELSRAVNLLNPNDLLAKRVIQVAKDHKNVETFIKGKYSENFFFRFKILLIISFVK